MYKDLKTLFHISAEEAEQVYQARLAADAITLPLTHQPPFFFLMVPDIYQRILDAERLDRKVSDLALSMPKAATDHYITSCMIDEIILTNDIEGVASTRKEVEEALRALERSDKRLRFQGITNRYNSLFLGESISLATCEDIRALYDELVLDEVIKADPNKAPDGKLFRKDTVRVVDAAQRIVHQNSFSEKTIMQELIKALKLFNDQEVEPLIRSSLFHFLFAYIHPFYDGNGRMNRFMSSYLITQKFSRYAGLRLSFSVKENINKYYAAFTLAEHPLNKGDLTPFVVTFLDIIIDALQKTYDALYEKRATLEHLEDQLQERLGSGASKDALAVGSALLQGSLFTSKGLCTDDIASDVGISIPTVHKHLDFYEEAGLRRRERSGRRVYYSMDMEALASAQAKPIPRARPRTS